MIFFFFTFLFARWKIEILRDEIYLFLCLFSIEFRVFFLGGRNPEKWRDFFDRKIGVSKFSYLSMNHSVLRFSNQL